jgi:hypothetical protein
MKASLFQFHFLCRLRIGERITGADSEPAASSRIVEYDSTAPVGASADIGSLLRKRRRHG